MTMMNDDDDEDDEDGDVVDEDFGFCFYILIEFYSSSNSFSHLQYSYKSSGDKLKKWSTAVRMCQIKLAILHFLQLQQNMQIRWGHSASDYRKPQPPL